MKVFQRSFAVLLLATATFVAPLCAAEKPPFEQIRNMVEAYKKDERGPYQGIRWFCPDGSVRPANAPCGQPGERQHGLLRDEVKKLGEEHHIFLGQILEAGDQQAFWDARADNGRAKQYQLERYLQAVDDGWIMRRARYYRGARQAESEEKWGREFLLWLLQQDRVLDEQFFLARQLTRDLPREADKKRADRIRALSSTIADSVPAFVDLKNKIHSQPDQEDRQRVVQFLHKNQGGTGPAIRTLLEQLAGEIEAAYRAVEVQNLRPYLARTPADSPVAQGLKELLALGKDSEMRIRYAAIAELLWRIRTQLPSARKALARLALMELSLDLEQLLFRLDAQWSPQTVRDLLDKNYALARAAAGCGFMEVWEWEELELELWPPAMSRTMGLPSLAERVEHTRRAVSWSTGMVVAVYGEVVELFSGFEPQAQGFIDDQVRGSILLPWGQVAGRLAELYTRFAGVPDQVLGLPSQSQIRGQNPGFALGELVVVDGPAEGVEFSDRKIYALLGVPSDLKPVAGMATVAEGNAVSHVQLLARNLGIPNAVLSPQLLQELKPFSGQKVLYAVSPRGRVVLKKAEEMTEEEKALFAVRQRREERIQAPTDKLDLERLELLSLHALRAADSGRLCGPKAANLGQLSALFPDKVTPGLVIPFGVFRQHMDQPMPGTGGSHWQFLQETFAQAARQRQQGMEEARIEAQVLAELARLREAIKVMPFLPAFEKSLEERFHQVLGAPLGEVAVFVRSDTNMEDLKDFVGAGLNLTVPNARDAGKIRQAIRDVWASPFTERSYRWRQKYLLNPENVYPSLLLMKSLPADRSGVMITTGVSSGNSQDITVAFNRGVGGAVEGQVAESYLLREDGTDALLSPARERRYAVLLAQGGVGREIARFDEPILTAMDRIELRRLAAEIRRLLPATPGIESTGPFDVELGFWQGTSYLFQVRPFVESRKAQSSLYLRGLDPPVRADAWISLAEAVDLR